MNSLGPPYMVIFPQWVIKSGEDAFNSSITVYKDSLGKWCQIKFCGNISITKEELADFLDLSRGFIFIYSVRISDGTKTNWNEDLVQYEANMLESHHICPTDVDEEWSDVGLLPLGLGWTLWIIM